MKKFLIILLALCSLVGIGYCAYQVYDTFTVSHISVTEKPEVGYKGVNL